MSYWSYPVWSTLLVVIPGESVADMAGTGGRGVRGGWVDLHVAMATPE